MLVLLIAILVLVWARASNLPFAALGFTRPRNWVSTVVLGALAGVAFKLVMKSVAMPLLGAPPMNPYFQYLAGNPAALAGMLFTVVVVAGFGEETVYRGFLFERLGRWLGPRPASQLLIVLITTSIFAVAHYPEQGIPGVQQAAVFGLVFGAVYAATRQLWPLMIAHAAFDVTAVVLIYRGWESSVAQWFFE